MCWSRCLCFCDRDFLFIFNSERHWYSKLVTEAVGLPLLRTGLKGGARVGEDYG